jgi:hypothetical protein
MSKKFLKLEAEHNGVKCIIKEDLPEVGWYMYVYRKDKDNRDELQNTLTICKEQALKDYGIPMDAWKEVEE